MTSPLALRSPGPAPLATSLYARPGVTFQVAFDTDPNSVGAATPDWTILSGRLLTVDAQRSSRTDELDRYQAGTMTVALLNADGALNPVNPSGDWYGKLKPYRPCRLVANWQGTDYTLWQGYVERWPQTWSDPALGISKIQCVDAFALLAQINLDSVYAAEVLADGPTVYYPMGEQSGSTTAGNQSAVPYPPGQIVHTKQVNATTPGTFAFGAQLDVVGAAAQTGLGLTGTNNNNGTGVEDGYGLVLPRLPITWGGWTVELWCQLPTTPAQYSVLFRAVSATKFTPTAGPFSTDPPGEINLIPHGDDTELRICTPDSIYGSWMFGRNLADNRLHHVVVTYTPGTVTGYVDGVLVLTGSIASTDTSTVTSFAHIGAAVVNAQTLPASPAFDGRPLIGTVAHVAIYPQTLAAGRIGVHHTAGADGFQGELSGQRATRLLAYGGWQPPLQALDPGRSTMSAASGVAGGQLLSVLQDVADAELGTLTVTATGRIDFRGRDDRMDKTSATIIFGQDTPSGQIPYLLDPLAFDYDPTLVANDIQVSRPDGITAEAVDSASIVQYFPRIKQLTMNVDTDDQAQNAADWILQRESQPALRVEMLTVDAGAINPVTNPGLWPALLTLDLHDRAQLNHQPLGATQISMNGFVEQLRHKIDASAWQVSVQLSPVLADYWILEDPVQGYIDSTNLIAF